MNWKVFERKHSWSDQATLPAFAWRDWGELSKSTVKILNWGIWVYVTPNKIYFIKPPIQKILPSPPPFWSGEKSTIEGAKHCYVEGFIKYIFINKEYPSLCVNQTPARWKSVVLHVCHPVQYIYSVITSSSFTVLSALRYQHVNESKERQI
jgi:hypothetical protein